MAYVRLAIPQSQLFGTQQTYPRKYFPGCKVKSNMRIKEQAMPEKKTPETQALITYILEADIEHRFVGKNIKSIIKYLTEIQRKLEPLNTAASVQKNKEGQLYLYGYQEVLEDA